MNGGGGLGGAGGDGGGGWEGWKLGRLKGKGEALRASIHPLSPRDVTAASLKGGKSSKQNDISSLEMHRLPSSIFHPAALSVCQPPSREWTPSNSRPGSQLDQKLFSRFAFPSAVSHFQFKGISSGGVATGGADVDCFLCADGHVFF